EHGQDPSLHGRHLDRGIRLRAVAVRACGCHSLSKMWLDGTEGHGGSDRRQRHAVARRHEVLRPVSVTEKSAAGSTCGAFNGPEAAGLQPDLPGGKNVRLLATGVA